MVGWCSDMRAPRPGTVHAHESDVAPTRTRAALRVAAPANAAPLDLNDPELYINRELSWLEFNQRVLDQALDDYHPLLERVKFLAIVGVEPRRVLHGPRRLAAASSARAGHRRHVARRPDRRPAARGDPPARRRDAERPGRPAGTIGCGRRWPSEGVRFLEPRRLHRRRSGAFSRRISSRRSFRC